MIFSTKRYWLNGLSPEQLRWWMSYLSTDHWRHGGLNLQWFLRPNYCQEEVNIHSAERNITVLGRCSSQSEQSLSVTSNSHWVEVVIGRLSSLLHRLGKKWGCSHTSDTKQTHTAAVLANTLQPVSNRDWEIEWKQHLVVCANIHAINTPTRACFRVLMWYQWFPKTMSCWELLWAHSKRSLSISQSIP